MVAVGSSDPYYKMWKGTHAIGLLLASKLVYPVSFVIGHFPGNVFGFAQRESCTVIRDWGRAVRRGGFSLKGDAFNYRGAKKSYSGLLLSISFHADRLAPESAVNYSLDKFDHANRKKHINMPLKMEDGIKLDHFNWARYPHYITDIIHKEIL